VNRYLVTSDIHLSDRPKDAYRFGLFPWLVNQQTKYKPDATYILGDITEFKDKHSSTLVNSLVSNLKMLTPPVYILRGNHDCISADNPFFDFLNEIEGIYFITFPWQGLFSTAKIAMIPHQRNQSDFDTMCKQVPDGYGWMLHQTCAGSYSETGAPLTGFNIALIEQKQPRFVLAGDVHKPQLAGGVMYIGSPYHIKHGDNFVPRVMLLNDDGTYKDLHFPAPKKLSLHIRNAEEILNNKYLNKGDQVKVSVQLAREEIVEWQKVKEGVLKACQTKGLEIYGVELLKPVKRERTKVEMKVKSDAEYLKTYCDAEQTPKQMRDVGFRLLGA
jgi:UDP-2,3-diacylglucosamine pyrophosphatase LpxH